MSKELEVTKVEQVTTWKRVLNAARRTIGKGQLEKEPSDSWKAKMLLAEHSPIRLLEFDVTIENIRQWVTVHIVRHWLGFIPFVHTQREDRRQLDCSRDELPQGSLNDMDFSANAQALINISRKRLCACASPETRAAWKAVIERIREVDPIMAEKCVPNCLYRGFCPEFMGSCGYANTEKFQEDLKKYRNTEYESSTKTE